METESYNILVVEDQVKVWTELSDFFESEIQDGILNLDFAATAKEGLKKIDTESNKTDIIIIDVILPDIPKDNESFLIDSLDKKFKGNQGNPSGFLVSAHLSSSNLKELAKGKDWITNTFIKPLNLDSLKTNLRKTLNISTEAQKFALESSKLDPELLKEVNSEAKIIRRDMKNSATKIIDAGLRLHRVKEKLPHGYFQKWIEQELGCHYTTGVNLMRVASVFGERQKDLSNISIAASILYQLATPSTPKQARDKVMNLIEKGDKISYAETKKIVKNYKDIANIEKQLEETKGKTEITQNKQQILKLIPQEENNTRFTNSTNTQIQWTELGIHRLFEVHPSSEIFRKQLPSEISSTIAFPKTAEWKKKELIPSQSQTHCILYSPFKDLDPLTLKILARNALELYTEGGDNIVFSFLPDPQLLFVAEALGCKCFIAEPDPQAIDNLLKLWEKRKLKG